jgi:shikimate 5-dehydrogenase
MKPQQLGLIGRDISYSLSPLIHSTSSKHLGIHAEYRLYDFSSAEDVNVFLQKAWENFWRPVNQHPVSSALHNYLEHGFDRC